MQAFVPKNRKPKFDLTIHITDLNNVPLVCGAAYVKWHLPSSSGAEHRGKTDKAGIRDHRAIWDYNKELSVRLTVDKMHYLQECDIHFEVIQEYHETGKGGRVTLGNVTLNLAEYTQAADLLGGDKDENEDGMITRRYLMQDSKVNATLKLGLRMKQTEGDSNYIPPPLKSAMVIGGIAGIMNAETGESEDMPSLTAKTREFSEAQDTYRRTLAATWACWTGELPPDRLIEDLFAGGDGGRMEPPPISPQLPTPISGSRTSGESDFSDGDSKRTVTQNHLTPDMARHNNHHHHHHHHHHRHGGNDNSGSHSSLVSGVSGRGSIAQSMQLSQSGRRKDQQETRDITEFDLRDNLKSWQVRVN